MQMDRDEFDEFVDKLTDKIVEALSALNDKIDANNNRIDELESTVEYLKEENRQLQGELIGSIAKKDTLIEMMEIFTEKKKAKIDNSDPQPGYNSPPKRNGGGTHIMGP